MLFSQVKETSSHLFYKSECDSSHLISIASLDFLLFSITILKVYMKGFRAEFSGSTKMAKATLTSPEIGMSPKARKPKRPMGNQHRKSVTATEINRLAIVMSQEVLVLSVFKVFF